MPDSEGVVFASLEQRDRIDAIRSALVRAAEGEQASLVAIAALQLAVGLWHIGGANRHEAEAVCLRALDAIFNLKPN